MQEITETIILEQFMDMLSTDMAIWIREHDPKTAEEAARLAEVFQSARLGTRGPSTSQWSSARSKSDGVTRSVVRLRVGQPVIIEGQIVPDRTLTVITVGNQVTVDGIVRREKHRTHDLAIHQDHTHHLHLTAQVT